MDSEKDRKVKRIARFLEIGGTMLAEHCENCGAPKFRYQGTVICPLCDVREEGEEKREEERKVSEEKEISKKAQIPKPRAESKPEEQNPQSAPSIETRNSPAEQLQEKEPWFAKKKEFSERKASFKSSEPRNSGVNAEISPKPLRDLKEAGASFQKSQKRVKSPAYLESSLETENSKKELEALLFRKLVSISASLQAETDPRRIKEIFELIETGLLLLKRLKKI